MQIVPLYLRVLEAAILLNISRSKAYLMIERGELPSVRVGGSIRIPRAELEEMMRVGTRNVKATN